jgi:hypothetical protein
MVRRRAQRYETRLGPRGKMIVRWEIERDVVRYAVTLVAEVDDAWRTVVVFDCSHDDRNDRHRYTFHGVKGPAETFHHGTPSEAMNDAISLIRAEHRRMIERWRR